MVVENGSTNSHILMPDLKFLIAFPIAGFLENTFIEIYSSYN